MLSPEFVFKTPQGLEILGLVDNEGGTPNPAIHPSIQARVMPGVWPSADALVAS